MTCPHAPRSSFLGSPSWRAAICCAATTVSYCLALLWPLAELVGRWRSISYWIDDEGWTQLRKCVMFANIPMCCFFALILMGQVMDPPSPNPLTPTPHLPPRWLRWLIAGRLTLFRHSRSITKWGCHARPR